LRALLNLAIALKNAKDVQHGGTHIIEIEYTYIPHAWVSKKLNGEQSHEDSSMKWNIYK
jgi:hypothetical protein